jgi:DNA repair protein RadA
VKVPLSESIKMAEDVEKIELDGVSSTTLAKLRKVGLTTYEAIAVTPSREIEDLTGMGADTAQKVSQLAREKIDRGFIPATEVLERRKLMIRCNTGSLDLNRILGGGIETGAITELIGEFGSGKTQICFTLSVLAQQPKEQGGFASKVCVIDTEGTFLPERIKQIAEARGLDATTILQNVLVARAYNSEHQTILIKNLPQVVQENNVKLVIIDSMIGHFRGEFIGRGTLSDRQQKIGACLAALLRVSQAFNLAIVLTNQVQAKPDTAYGDPNKPTGGHVMAHACTHRIYLRKGKENTRIAQVIDSPYLPEEKARFAVDAAGVVSCEQ